MARVTLLRPVSLIPKWSDSGPLTPPIGPAYLASSLREAGHTVSIIDAVGEAPTQVFSLFDDRVIGIGLTSEQVVERIEPETEVIGVSCMFSQDWPEIRRLIDLARDRFPGATIVAGGEHITAVREFTLESCAAVDCCVLGEGEETLVELANALDAGSSLEAVTGIIFRDADNAIRSTPPRARIRNVNNIPRPAWDLTPIEHYLDQGLAFGVDRGRSMPMLATRGCPFQCTFCSNPQMWTTRWIARDPAQVLDEIELYMREYGATNIDFYDLTFIVKRSWIIEFANLILERGLKFTWQLPSGTRSEAIDEEVTRLLYETGCRNITYAPESGSADVLKRIKKVVKLDHLNQSIRSALGNGLNVKVNMIMGFPDEQRSEIRATLRYLVKLGLMGTHDVGLSMFSPYPGSELYDELRAKGQIQLSDEYFLALGSYKDFSQTLSFTQGMSSRELSIYRLVGIALFYGTQYLRRPWRAFSVINNFVRNRQESRLDKSLQDMALRIRGQRKRSESRV